MCAKHGPGPLAPVDRLAPSLHSDGVVSPALGAPLFGIPMIDVTARVEMVDDARARANVARLAAAQALTGANSAVIFATGSIVGATLAPSMALATVPLSV